MCIYHSCQGKVQFEEEKGYEKHECGGYCMVRPARLYRLGLAGSLHNRLWSAFFIDLVENIRK